MGNMTAAQIILWWEQKLAAEKAAKLAAAKLAAELAAVQAKKQAVIQAAAIKEAQDKENKRRGRRKYFGSGAVPPEKKEVYFRGATDWGNLSEYGAREGQFGIEFGDWVQEGWAVWDNGKRKWKKFAYAYIYTESLPAYEKRLSAYILYSIPEFAPPRETGWVEEVSYINSKDKPDWDIFIPSPEINEEPIVAPMPISDLWVKSKGGLMKDNVPQRGQRVTTIRKDNVPQRTVSNLR